MLEQKGTGGTGTGSVVGATPSSSSSSGTMDTEALTAMKRVVGLKMRVSSNGLSVVLQQQGARQWRYPLYELPLEHRDRYRFVCQAVSCIRSLTPKLIVNDNKSRC